ncbi:hypothetical protein A3H38_06535 [candidate division WOR-1 bacterium RIFCSPLOWO2_02_FULL_46_20]|uniref:DJ-1/PfpI domain-containing protein n=2 Tax=Saganbacteria TaxID=1703751 RepID=A0A1F4RED5_UNCSA|nr:MAG: hypothetical protein A3H38_06535 [candidate division WOR-1 bacterium RIFCSPLOWO2_02_FULL_46_20]OGC09122.1 MAG: hypothetical protein A3F86_01435 [candidate division WOR-1 bacterium RIFCSPLOWO2_12_FULL_45_9]
MATNKRIALIIAFQGFRDEEYTGPKQVIEAAGIEVTTVSTQSGTATGKFGLPAKVDLLLNDLIIADYEAVVFIGGPGSYALRDNPTAHKIARETVKQGKILAAICAAPGILANAGVVKGKNITMFSDDGSAARGGANYTGKGVEVDGNIITATGPETAKAFGQSIVRVVINR